jgi:F-type H+-transporting ATPase subunit epsilon
MHVVIAKVDEIYFDGDACSLTAPGAEGEMTVLGSHEPLVTTLRPGVVTVRAASLPDGHKTFAVSDGVLEVRPDGATIIL